MSESGDSDCDTGVKRETKHEPTKNKELSGNVESGVKTKCRTRRGLARKDVALNTEDITILPENSIYSSKISQQWSYHSAPSTADQPLSEDSLTNYEGDKGKSTEREKNANHSCSSPVDGALKDNDVGLEIKDPTPPSSPKHKARQKKSKKRLSKGVVSAMTALRKIRKTTVDDVKDDVLIVEDDSQQSMQYSSITIKVRSPSGVKKFQLKQTESFAKVFASIAAMEKVDENDIFIFYGDKTVHIYDSPNALGITVADILDCHIGSQHSLSSEMVESTVSDFDDRMLLKLHFQMEDSRNKVTLNIRKDEPMEKVMRDFCCSTKQQLGSLKFSFDGETLDLSVTPDSLGLETDYCIDVLKS